MEAATKPASAAVTRPARRTGFRRSSSLSGTTITDSPLTSSCSDARGTTTSWSRWPTRSWRLRMPRAAGTSKPPPRRRCRTTIGRSSPSSTGAVTRTAPAANNLLTGFDRHQHRFGPGDFDLVADLHLAESFLVLDLGRVLPTVRAGERDRRYRHVDGCNRRRDADLPGSRATGQGQVGRGRGFRGAVPLRLAGPLQPEDDVLVKTSADLVADLELREPLDVRSCDRRHVGPVRLFDGDRARRGFDRLDDASLRSHL